jgi:hypothetical protein
MTTAPYRVRIVFSSILLLSATLGIGRAQTNPCPLPPNKVNAAVAGTVSFDSSKWLFTYSYSVSNMATSQQDIDSFNLDIEPPVLNAYNPPGWTSSIFSSRSTYGWDATQVSATVPDDGISIPPSIVQIKPGRALVGFSYQSPNPPGFVKYYVSGFSPIPIQQGEQGAENLVDACPQSVANSLDLAVTGSAVGPTKAVPVAIDVEPGKFPNRIDLEEQRTLPVAILGSGMFDVTTVDLTSLQAGAGRAATTDKVPVFQDVNGDGIPDLVVHFPVKALGLRCHDTALFLVGKKLDGTAFGGADSIVIVDCE